MPTIAEKILSNKVNHAVSPGEIIVTTVDGVMATDATAPFAIKAFEEMGGETIWDSSSVTLVIDHASPAPNEKVSNLHMLMRDFAKKHQIKLYDIGEGICHQLIVENEHVKPGDLFLGADSHTPTYGALGAFAVGVGSTDLAATLLTGKTWLKVPSSVKITLRGKLQPFVSAKDIILFLVGQIGISGANYEAIEFHGETVEKMNLSSRMVLTNMVAEMGAKTGFISPDGLQLPYDFTPVFADPDAEYREQFDFDLSDLGLQIAAPHLPDNVKPIKAVIGQKVDLAFIGSCTNSRLDDLHAAAQILEGQSIAAHTRLLIAPGSKNIFNQALADGTVEILSRAGATFITSGCGPCVGTHMGVPGDGETIISSANRNFQGRMGNPNSNIYLSSPAVVAATALAGEIIDPNTLGRGNNHG